MSNSNPELDTFVYRIYDTVENKFCAHGMWNLYSEKGKNIWNSIGPTKTIFKHLQTRTNNTLIIKKFKLIECINE